MAHRITLEAPAHDAQRIAAEHGLGHDHGRPGAAPFWATPDQISALQAAGHAITVLPTPPAPGDGYRMPDVGGAELEALAAASDRAGLVRLGTSIEGRPIDALWLGQPPESGAPAYRILSGHHGDEWSAFEVALATAHALAAGDGPDPQLTGLLDQATIWIVPYVNPDGVVASTRWNARGIDLNRNYDYAWTASEFLAGSSPFSEPEVRAVRTFGHWVQPVLALSLHSGAANFGWVWNHTTLPAADAAELEAEAERYAAQTSMPDFWITNGADWYVTHGDTNDWAYGRHGVWDSTLELTEDKSPPAPEIAGFVDAHLPAMLDFVSLLPDHSGRVISAASGLPVDASVTLLDGDGPTGRPFRTEPGTGWFHRISRGTPTDLFVSAPGYRDTTASVGTPEIVLQPLDLREAIVLPAPAIAGDRLELPESLEGPVTLRQPGHPDVDTTASSGILDLEPASLAAGAWTVELPDGSVIRHGLLRPSTASPLYLQAVGDHEVEVSGLPFPPGTRAWALHGLDRARVPVPVESLGSSLRIDLTGTPPSGRLDLWIVAGGQHLFVEDINESAPETYGLDLGKPELVGRACACDVKPGHLRAHAGSALSILLLLLFRRSP